MRIHLYRPPAFLKVTGEDAFSFLQGQFTNELRQEAGHAAYGLWLNQKGRVLADSYVLRKADREFTVVSTTSLAAVIGQRLQEFIVADDVTLVDATDEVFGLAIWGPRCGERLGDLLGVVPGAGRFSDAEQLEVFLGRRIKGENFEIIGPEGPISGLSEKLLKLDFKVASAAEAEQARLAEGIPEIPQDIGPSDLPQEGGLETTAISYTKGCYLGQEVMARLRTRGQVRRSLRVVHGSGPVPEARTPIHQGSRKMGEIRSAAMKADGFIALAMLAKLDLDEKAGLSLAPDGVATMRIMPNG